MTPIEKNIRVIDESGNEYETTYPKRANGLVKKGRARFVDDTTICLDNACPAGINKPEYKKMDNNISLNDSQKQSGADFVREQINRMMSLLETTNPDGEPYMMVNNVIFEKVNSMLLNFMEHSNDYDETPEEPSMKYVMSRIDMIIRDNQHIKSALTAIDTMQVNESPNGGTSDELNRMYQLSYGQNESHNGGTGDAARAEAIQSAVQSRENTNQKILEMLDKMYDDLKPQRPDIKETMFQSIIEATTEAGPFTEERINLIEKYSELLDNLRHVN